MLKNKDLFTSQQLQDLENQLHEHLYRFISSGHNSLSHFTLNCELALKLLELPVGYSNTDLLRNAIAKLALFFNNDNKEIYRTVLEILLEETNKLFKYT